MNRCISCYVAVAALGFAAAMPTAVYAQVPEGPAGELLLDAALIGEFIQVIYFAEEGRYHFREYSTCSYEFLQNPTVAIDGDLLRVSADYYRRRATEAIGGCVGGPGADTVVRLTARLGAGGSKLAIEILEVTTEAMPQLSGMLLQLAGISPPMTHEVDLMDALNRILYENQPFGIASLDIHELAVTEEGVRLRLAMTLGPW